MKNILLPILAMCFWPISIVKADNSLAFKNFSIAQGLSQKTVYALAQDHHNYIWLGTQVGLNRFDGTTFRTYYHNANNKQSIASNNIFSLCCTPQGNLYIGTNIGLSEYLPEQDAFANYSIPGEYPQIYDLLPLSEQPELLLATDRGLYLFNTHSKQIKKSISNCGSILSLCYFKKDAILIGTAKGIFFYYTHNQNMTRILHEINDIPVSDIAYDPIQENIWIATLGKGLFCINRNFQIINHYQEKSPVCPIPSNYIRRIEMDSNGTFWIGTMNGVYSASTDMKKIMPIKPVGKGRDSNPLLSVRSILKDKQGGIWLGTYNNGCYYHNDKLPLFQSEPFSIAETPAAYINCIAKDTINHTIWVGDSEQGIYTYDMKKKRLSRFQINSPVANKIERIKCFLIDEDGYLYIGTHLNGIFRINPKSGSAKQFNISLGSQESNSCYSMFNDGKEHIWLGSGRGLYLFNKKTFSISPLSPKEGSSDLSKALIGDISIGRKNNIWLATDKGVFRTNRQLAKITPITYPGKEETIPASEILSSQTSGIIWINSTNGFYRYDSKRKTFELYSSEDGLPSHSFKGMMEDKNGNIWLNSNRGIIRFNPQNKTFKLYTEENGVLPNTYEQQGFFKTDDNRFICLGNNGINIFVPEQFQDNNQPPIPFISGCYLHGQAITYNSSNARMVYNRHGELSEISYSSKYTELTITFSAIDFFSNAQNRFAYKLEGTDKEWNITQFHSVTYPNLGPGHYRLLVKASNDNGQWNEMPTVLTIDISPQWYETWYVKGTGILLVIILITLAIRAYLLHTKMQTALLWEQKDKIRLEETNEEKIRFYTNISHELRTPINLILSPLEELISNKKKLPQEVSEKIIYIHNSSRKLINIINQELDLRRTESDLLPLQVSTNNISEIINEVCAAFYYEFQKRQQSVKINNEIDRPEVWCDRSYIEKILSCLLSNAVKFTPNSGEIVLSLTKDESLLNIQIKNTGEGIDAKKLDLIFKRFYKAKEQSTGFGIGLALTKKLVEKHHGTITAESIPSQWTTFTVTIPCSENTYTDTEKKVKSNEKCDYSYIIDTEEEDEEKSEINCSNKNDMARSILIATADKKMGKYLHRFFGKEYNTIEAVSAETVPAILKSQNVDLILSDFLVNEDNGMFFYSNIKRNLQTSHIPIILLADKEDNDLKLKSAQAGIDEFILKPFSISMLEAKVKNLLMLKSRLYSHISNKLNTEYSQAAMNTADKEFIEQVVRIIEKNISNDQFTPDDLAQQLNMGRSSLYTRMNEIIGEPPANFIRKIRIDKACVYLNEGRYRISEISDMVGFSTASYFTSCFKKEKGCLPKNYIQKTRLH